MPLPIIGGVVRAACIGVVQGGGPWVNVQHWMYADGASSPGTTEITALHALLTRLYYGTAFGAGAPWFNACASGTSMSRVDYTVLNGTSLGLTLAAVGNGSGGATTTPAEVAAVLTLRTNTRGRRYRGRIYLPAPGSSATNITSDGKLSATILTAVVTQAQGLRTAAAAIQWKPVVASYGKSLINDPADPHDKIEVTWTPFATEVTTYTLDAVLDVQRRRKS